MCNRCNYDSPDNQIYVDPLTNEYYLDIETSEWDEYEDGFSMYSFYEDINGMNADEYIAYVMKLYRAEMERLANDKMLPDGVRKYREKKQQQM